MSGINSSAAGLANTVAQLQNSLIAAQMAMTAISAQTVNLQMLMLAFEPQKTIASLIPPPSRMNGVGQNLNVLA